MRRRLWARTLLAVVARAGAWSGGARPQARTQDLEQVLQALERGDSPPFTSTVAIGCPIPAL